MVKEPGRAPYPLEVVAELMRRGVEMKRLSLRRRHPDESDDEIEERLRSWLEDLEERDVGPCLRAGPWPRVKRDDAS